MPNKSLFNAGRTGRTSGRSPTNNLVVARNFKGEKNSSNSEIVAQSRRSIGEEYNKFQDRIKNEFEQYLQQQKLEKGIGLDVIFALIDSFLTQRKAEEQFGRQVENGKKAVKDLIKNPNEIRELEVKLKNPDRKINTKLPSLITTLVIMALAFNQTEFKPANNLENLENWQGDDSFDFTSNSVSQGLNKATDVMLLGAFGGLAAGPIGAVAGASIGLMTGVEAKEQASKKQTSNVKAKSPQKEVSNSEFESFADACFESNLPLVRENLKKARQDNKLQSLLTKGDSANNNATALYIAANQGNHEIVREILLAAKDDKKLLRTILVQTDSKGNTPLYMASVLGRHDEVVKEILEVVKNDKELLEEILTQTDSEGGSPLYIAAAKGNREVVKEILSVAKNDKSLLKIILTKANMYGFSPLSMACIFGKDEVVEEIKEILRLPDIKNDKDIVSSALINYNVSGSSPFYLAVAQGHTKTAWQLIQILKLTAVSDDKEFLEKFFQANKEGNSPLYDVAKKGRHKMTSEMLSLVNQYHPSLLDILIKNKPTDSTNSWPTLINHLLLSGDDRSVKTLLNAKPDLVIEKLPNIYYSDTPKMAIYYLEALLKNHESLNDCEIKYFEIDLDSKSKKEVKIGDINLSSDKGNPTIIEITKNKATRRVILTDEFDVREENRLPSLKKMLDVANDEKTKSNSIVFNIDLLYSEGGHAITINLVRNKKYNNWDVIIHDPNNHRLLPVRREERKKINEDKVKEICQKFDIEIGSIKESKAIIPNYANHNIEGSCDMISSIAAASIILGENYSNELRQKCDRIGENCVEVLGRELNPKIDEILEARLKSIKASIEAEKKDQAPKTSVKAKNSEKLSRREIERSQEL